MLQIIPKAERIKLIKWQTKFKLVETAGKVYKAILNMHAIILYKNLVKTKIYLSKCSKLSQTQKKFKS